MTGRGATAEPVTRSLQMERSAKVSGNLADVFKCSLPKSKSNHLIAFTVKNNKKTPKN